MAILTITEDLGVGGRGVTGGVSVRALVHVLSIGGRNPRLNGSFGLIPVRPDNAAGTSMPGISVLGLGLTIDRIVGPR